MVIFIFLYGITIRIFVSTSWKLLEYGALQLVTIVDLHPKVVVSVALFTLFLEMRFGGAVYTVGLDICSTTQLHFL